MKEWEPVELLRHVRHDWLNQIQLIKGYHALGKIEKVNETIDNIILKSNQESKLSSINLPKLALLLMTYNWESPAFLLTYNVIGKGKVRNTDDHEVTRWFSSFFHMLDEVATDGEENELNITINIIQEEASFFIEFYGILKDIKTVENYLREENKRYKVEKINIHEEAFSFELVPVS